MCINLPTNNILINPINKPYRKYTFKFVYPPIYHLYFSRTKVSGH